MPKGIYNHYKLKGHKFYPGGEAGWFRKGHKSGKNKGKHWKIKDTSNMNKLKKGKIPKNLKSLWGKWSSERRKKLSDIKKGKMPTNKMREGKFMNIKRGYYDINGKKMFFRSKWEVNYALYLDWLVKEKQILSWEYEADIFMFEKIKLGTRSYRPDFKIFNNNGTIEYHEIKGWMDKKSATKLKRMRIYYPEIKLIVIEKAGYMDLVKKVSRICGFI